MEETVHALYKDKPRCKSTIQSYYVKILQGKVRRAERMIRPMNVSIDGQRILDEKGGVSLRKWPRKELKESGASEENRENVGKLNNVKDDDDMSKLHKLSLINMGARYELVNANRMLVDLDINLKVIDRAKYIETGREESGESFVAEY
eukprot:TRINITY_DN886_c0_g5_i4.p3 TRINITY_DN886_c0_g5~~TRINITY_DN886_c0_g5_i4.p3  ORF type:complete len:148 (+),score=42.08 TRINITY_DN886_c0_g5_i4:483-926(+)